MGNYFYNIKKLKDIIIWFQKKVNFFNKMAKFKFIDNLGL